MRSGNETSWWNRNWRRPAGRLDETTSSLIVLANRAPYVHSQQADGSTLRLRSASGLVTAIEPLLRSTGGTWVAHGEPADLAAMAGAPALPVTSASGDYRLRYVDIPPAEYRGFYEGFANEGLWPLCHSTHVAPSFRASDFARYASANRRFAAAVCESAADGSPVVLIQDYHFALAPRAIRRKLRHSSISSFWHIPWPDARTFRTCPWARTLLEALLGSDAIGLQTDEDCRHFLDAVTLLVDCDVDPAACEIQYERRTVRVRAYPVGVEWEPAAVCGVPSPAECRQRLLQELGRPEDTLIVVGVDRMDYTKGLVEKFLAVELLLERRADLRSRFVLVQIAEPSRQTIDAYREARRDAASISERVNARFGTADRKPIELRERHFDAPEVFGFYRAADACYVNSLADGMNLVAKEFVAARHDERGALILSERAGASRQLTDALLVNPIAVERSARTLERALHMAPGEQTRRMAAMRRVVAETGSTWWAERLLRDVVARRRAANATSAEASPVPLPGI